MADDQPAVAGRILILDDDELLSSLLAIALDRAGYESVTAADLATANEVLDTQRVDLIVSDHILAGEHLGDGFTAECVRSGRVNAAILISGLADVRQPENRECSTFLQKPFTMATFVQTIARVLEQSSGNTSAATAATPESAPTR